MSSCMSHDGWLSWWAGQDGVKAMFHDNKMVGKEKMTNWMP